MNISFKPFFSPDSRGSDQKKGYRCFLFILLFTFLPINIASAGPIDTLKPGEWYEAQGTKMRTVVPNPPPPGIVGPPAVMIAWSGAAYDTSRERLMVWGGGHADYGGNELYVFDINTLQWARIWGPSAGIPEGVGTCSETYPDGNPASRHTYDGLEYLPLQDRFWANGGALYCGSGGSSLATWTFDISTLKWERKMGLSNAIGSTPVSAYDPVTGHIFFQGYVNFLEYDPASDTWTKRGSYDKGISGGHTAAIDPKRRKFIMIGGGEVVIYDIGKTGTLPMQKISTTGSNEIVSNAKYSGIDYDPVSDRIIVWNGGTSVYSLNMDTYVWTLLPPAPTNVVIPTSPPTQGTFGRFRYIPSKNAFILVNSIDDNVYFYKLSAGAPPPSLPPTGFKVSRAVTDN